METNSISKTVEQQGQDFAKEVMAMNRSQRRAFAKVKGTGKIYGSTTPITITKEVDNLIFYSNGTTRRKKTRSW